MGKNLLRLLRNLCQIAVLIGRFQLLFLVVFMNEDLSSCCSILRYLTTALLVMQLVELLSVRAPSPEKKLKLLKEIADEHELEWDPSPSESELFKSHEDLLVSNTPLELFEIFFLAI